MKRAKLHTTLAEWRESATLEKHVSAELEELLAYNGWAVFRTDVIHAVVDYGDRGRRRVKQNMAGDPDLIATRSRMNAMSDVWQAYKGPPVHLPSDVIMIETKRRSGGRLSRKQILRHEVLRKQGHTVIVARSWDELVRKADDLGLRVERWVER